MTILAFDTCFNACSVAIGIERSGTVECVAEIFEEMATGQAERLIPMISQALKAARMTMRDIHLIAVTVGPGTFTGARIGVSAAKALALNGKIRLIGLSSLQLMAREASFHADPSREIGVAIDVKRDELYIQTFDNSGRIAKSAPVLMTVNQARSNNPSSELFWLGSGAKRLVEQDRYWEESAVQVHLPRARFALDLLASDQLHNVADSQQRPLAPLYLRAADAKPSTAAALQRQ